jgi:uncharacterized membrane protein YdjX (TVP38/TMEM64 family)
MIQQVHRAKEHALLLSRDAWRLYQSLHVVKRAMVALGAATMAIVGILFLIFHDEFFKLLVAFSVRWKEMPGGGILLFCLILLISFPPLIGYSALSSLVGMIYGFPWGWPFLCAATLLGSLMSFLVFRYLLAGYAKRLATTNTKFAALTKTMEQDRFELLWMIRLCPLPYSLSNGALSSIPSVTPSRFFLATALTSPKLLIHIFIGDRLARLGTEKDTTTKIIDIISIGIAVVVGTLTAYIIYNRTMQRAQVMEAVAEYAELEEGVDEFELSSEDEDSEQAR